MPEALARADHDFVLREDARPARARRARTPEPKAPRFALLRSVLRGRTILFGGAAVLLCGIGVNALFLQSDRHPAPFFKASERARLQEQAAAVEAAAIPVPPSRPAAAAPAVKPPAAPIERAASPAPEARPQRETMRDTQRTVAAQTPKPEAKPEARPEPRGDAIAALLREGRSSAPTPPATIPNPTAEQTKRVIAVQEALKKLGHSVKPNGVAGPSTRAAIEQFERTQKMAPSGQMSPRVLRELAARSGVRIP